MASATIKSGFYRGTKITNKTFELITEWKDGVGGGFVTIYNEKATANLPQGRLRIKCDADAVTYEGLRKPIIADDLEIPESMLSETDDQVKDRLRERFAHLSEMTKAAARGVIRGLVVCGAPGTGKSFGVEHALSSDNVLAKLGQREPNFTVVKGHVSPVGLYKTLYEMKDPKKIIVFDDCDSVLEDPTSLNLLKAALDSTEKRRLSWNSMGHFLDRQDLPNSFDFEGGVIFITNINFERIVEAGKSKLAPHLEAIVSRCHVLDLTLDTYRDKFLRIEQVINDHDMLAKQCLLDPPETEEVLSFMKIHGKKLREMSLRMAIKIADLRKVNKNNWRRLAQITCMKREFVNIKL